MVDMEGLSKPMKEQLQHFNFGDGIIKYLANLVEFLQFYRFDYKLIDFYFLSKLI
jgi:hypothetical protein